MNFLRRIRRFITKRIMNRADVDLRAIVRRRVTLHPTVRIGPWTVVDGEAGSVEIGSGSSVNAQCWIGAGASRVVIGPDVRIGAGTKISCAAHKFEDTSRPIREQGLETDKDTIIEGDTFIGVNATVCPGVRIGKGAVVGAGAVVTKDVPPLAVVAGVPARVLRYRGEKKTA